MGFGDVLAMGGVGFTPFIIIIFFFLVVVGLMSVGVVRFVIDVVVVATGGCHGGGDGCYGGGGD